MPHRFKRTKGIKTHVYKYYIEFAVKDGRTQPYGRTKQVWPIGFLSRKYAEDHIDKWMTAQVDRGNIPWPTTPEPRKGFHLKRSMSIVAKKVPIDSKPKIWFKNTMFGQAAEIITHMNMLEYSHD